MERILIIDDDTELCDLVTEYLEPDGFAVEAVNNPELGLARGLAGEHSLIVLDVMMPGLNGFEVLRRLRTNSRLPVLMLTARGSDVDRIVGLELGADDYLPKPFNPRELVARIRAILRRTTPANNEALSSGRTVVGEVELDAGARIVRCAGEKIELTSAEFDLLVILLQTAGNGLERIKSVRGVGYIYARPS